MISVLKMFWALSSQASPTWEKIAALNEDRKTLLSNHLIPQLGLGALLVFIGNFSKSISLQANLKDLVLYIAPLYFAVLILDLVFRKKLRHKIKISPTEYLKLICFGMLPYTIFSCLEHSLSLSGWASLILKIAAFSCYVYVYMGCVKSLKLEFKPALVFSLIQTTAFVLLHQLLYAGLSMLNNKFAIDLLSNSL